METFSRNLFELYGNQIVLIHAICVFLWFTSMIATRLFVRDKIADMEENIEKLGKQISVMNTFFLILFPIFTGLLFTLFIIVFSLGEHINLYLKLILWIFMLSNFIGMYRKLFQAKKFFEEDEYQKAQETMSRMTSFLLPLGIIVEVLTLIVLMILWIGVDIHLLNAN